MSNHPDLSRTERNPRMPKLGKSQADQEEFIFSKVFYDSVYLIAEISACKDLEDAGMVISTKAPFSSLFGLFRGQADLGE